MTVIDPTLTLQVSDDDEVLEPYRPRACSRAANQEPIAASSAAAFTRPRTRRKVASSGGSNRPASGSCRVPSEASTRGGASAATRRWPRTIAPRPAPPPRRPVTTRSACAAPRADPADRAPVSGRLAGSGTARPAARDRRRAGRRASPGQGCSGMMARQARPSAKIMGLENHMILEAVPARLPNE